MTWWQRLWHRQQLDEELERELHYHLDQHIANLIAQGHHPDEARRQARLALGGLEQVKENCRDARRTRWLEDLIQDFRYALRTFRQRPGFAAVALLTLALGTGATTVMFTVVESVLLKPLPYPEPDRLVSLHEQTEKYGTSRVFSYPNFLDCQRESHSLKSMAAWRSGGGTVSEPGEAEYVSGRQVSASLFSVLGIPLLRGREFRTAKDRPSGTPAAIISYRFWQKRYHGHAGAIGARLVYDGRPYTVVGIASARFRISEDVDVFTPIGQNTSPTMQNREMHPGIHVVARLGPSVSLAQAQSELALIGRHLADQYPKANTSRIIGARPLRQEVVGDVRPTLWLLLGAVSLVLMIACVNVASLLLARAVSRERELAMRMALGAGRGRLIRQCLTESAILAICGGALGVLLAAVGTRPFLVFWPGGLPRAEEVHLDWRVLLFALAASLLSGVLFGLAPALRAPARDLERSLRAGGRTITGNSRRLHRMFVISEIAIAIVLLLAAGAIGRTLLRISSLDPGLDTHNVLVTQVALSSDVLTSPERIRAAWRQILDGVHHLPGVQSVAVSDIVPMDGGVEQIGYWTGPTAPAADQIPAAQMFLVTADYLQVMRIPLLQGRFFTEQDHRGGEPVVAIDEVLARQAFHGRDPVGQRLSLQFLGPVRVVGVVGHVRHSGLDADDQAKVREQVYVPFTQLPDPFLRLTSGATSLIIRTTIAPLHAVEAVRRRVRGSTRDQAIYEIRTMEQILSGTLSRQRLLLLLFGIFAGLALLLACIGIYGVMAYLTSQRVPEFGLRIALGATAHHVIALVLKESLAMILAGVACGALISLATGRLLQGLINGAKAADAVNFISMILVLILAALFASFLPARRASRIDPMKALRQE